MSEVEVRGSKDQKRIRSLISANPSLVGFAIPITVGLFYLLLGWIDDTTELWPRHDRSIDGCFWLGGIVALGIATFVVRHTKKLAIWRRIATVAFGSLAASDYAFMLQHRRPGDPAKNPDEISSMGYFCAKVTMQRSGSAIRVLHAGSRTLPSGTVIICPQLQPIAPSQSN